MVAVVCAWCCTPLSPGRLGTCGPRCEKKLTGSPLRAGCGKRETGYDVDPDSLDALLAADRAALLAEWAGR